MKALKKSLWGGSEDSKDKQNASTKHRKHSFDLSTEPKPGFLGNLSYEQFDVLRHFKKKYGDAVKCCVDSNASVAFSKEEESLLSRVLPAKDGQDCPPSVHSFSEIDSFLLRLLRARNFDMEKASAMMDEYIRWRVAFHVKDICVVRWLIVQNIEIIRLFAFHGFLLCA